MRSLFKSRKIISVCMVIVLMFLLVPATYAASESESNNTYSTADITTDDANNTGTISSLNDVDWWKVTFNQDGWANYWLGELKGVNDFDLALYDSNGTTLLEESLNGSSVHELIRYKVKKDRTYYIKISAYHIDSTAAKTYKFRAKVYDAGKAFPFEYKSDIDSTFTGTTILQNLWNMGYTGTTYFNNSATTVFNSLPQADVFIFSHHGFTGGGGVVCGTPENKSYIYAENGGYGTLNICDAASLANTELVIWTGCYTGATSSSYGNLVDETLEKGAKCAIGWTVVIYDRPSTEWIEFFIASCEQGETIKTAIEDACFFINSRYKNHSNPAIASAYSNYYVGSSNIYQVIG